jgi:hypothetical protein
VGAVTVQQYCRRCDHTHPHRFESAEDEGIVARRRYNPHDQIFKEIMDLLCSQQGCQRWMTTKEISTSLHLERTGVYRAMRCLHEQGLVTTRSWANGFLEYSACDNGEG